jgi:hypothetical protein
MTREQPSLETLRSQNIEVMDKVQRIDRNKDECCSEFFDIISKDRKLLEKIHSSCKSKDDALVSSGER